MNVMSLRLSLEEQRHIMAWAKQGKKDRSQAARELLECGWKFMLLERYRGGKVSLGFVAREMGISVSEAMDFLAEHGVAAHLDYDDYLKGVGLLRRAF